MEGCRDGHLGDFYRQNLESRFTVATWNVRGINPKITEVLATLKKKSVDICGFQETKSRPKTENCGGYQVICLDRVSHYYGLGFAVKKDIEVIEASSISDRRAYIKIRKCSKWGIKSEEKRKVFYRLEKKSKMVIIKCYAPHMGLVQKNPMIAENN